MTARNVSIRKKKEYPLITRGLMVSVAAPTAHVNVSVAAISDAWSVTVETRCSEVVMC